MRTRIALSAVLMMTGTALAASDVNKRFDACTVDACRGPIVSEFRNDMWDEFSRWKQFWDSRARANLNRLMARALDNQDAYYRHRSEAIKSEAYDSNADFREAWQCRAAAINMKYALAALTARGVYDDPPSETEKSIKSCLVAHELTERQLSAKAKNAIKKGGAPSVWSQCGMAIVAKVPKAVRRYQFVGEDDDSLTFKANGHEFSIYCGKDQASLVQGGWAGEADREESLREAALVAEELTSEPAKSLMDAARECASKLSPSDDSAETMFRKGSAIVRCSWNNIVVSADGKPTPNKTFAGQFGIPGPDGKTMLGQ